MNRRLRASLELLDFSEAAEEVLAPAGEEGREVGQSQASQLVCDEVIAELEGYSVSSRACAFFLPAPAESDSMRRTL